MVKQRLDHMTCLFPTKYMNTVEGYVKGYTMRNREKAEHIIGRAAVYFPLFEKHLQEAGLPEELKYLAIVESALTPVATSRSGAGGLWQFMPETGRHFGLYVDAYADQRNDPNRSTIAALEYLKQLHERFGSWELALAAYNGGPGRVNRAIRRSGSRDFWRLRRYLPRETRNYIPAFIAATYLMKNYKAHRLQPYRVPLDYQLTTSTKVYRHTNLADVAEVCDLPLTVVEMLNPSYTAGFIPASAEGNYLILPERTLKAFVEFIRLRAEDHPYARSVVYRNRPMSTYNDKKYYDTFSYFVSTNETLQQVARTFNCPVQCIMDWNDLEVAYVQPGQEIKLYRPREERGFLPARSAPMNVEPLDAAVLPTLTVTIAPPSLRVRPRTREMPEVTKVPRKHRLKTGESLRSVALKYNISVERLMRLNGYSRLELPGAGDVVRLR